VGDQQEADGGEEGGSEGGEHTQGEVPVIGDESDQSRGCSIASPVADRSASRRQAQGWNVLI
jgi:hypothetical protein